MERPVYIPAERQKKMIEYIEAHTSAQIHELSEQFNVSEATVRRDLDELDRQGALRRTHGGAIKMDRSTSYEHMYSEKIGLMAHEKQHIAQRAAQMVRPGDTVMIDSGTTTFFIAQALSAHENLTIITNDLYIAFQTPIHPSSTLIVTGGMRRQMLKAGMRSVIAADHSKFGRVALARICELSEVDTILTDNGLEEETLTRLRRLPVDILTV